MRTIDADAIPYTMIYRENWMRGTGGEEQAAWKSAIDAMPTIEPERKKGKWIECEHEKWVVGVHALRCSECNGGYHLNNEVKLYHWNYCPNCGADLRGD